MMIGIGMIVFILLVFAAGIWKMTVKSQTPKRPAQNKTPGMPYQDIIIPSGEAKLRGWFVPVETGGEQSPLIILAHGWGSNKSRMLRYLLPLHREGYAVMMFDVRSHGESDDVKAPTVKVFYEDIVAAVRYALRREDVDRQRVGLIAHSFGGFGGIIANTKQLGIRALVTDSMPTRFRSIMEASLSQYKLPYYPLGPILSMLMFMRAGISRRELKQFNVLEAMDHQKAPVLMIHSKYDDYVPPAELAYLIDHGKVDGTMKSHLFVESKGHRGSETDPRFWPTVLEFLRRQLTHSA